VVSAVLLRSFIWMTTSACSRSFKDDTFPLFLCFLLPAGGLHQARTVHPSLVP
jgi:hypothetical protein